MPTQTTYNYQVNNSSSQGIISQDQEGGFQVETTNGAASLGGMAQVTNQISAFLKQQIAVMENVTIQLQVICCGCDGGSSDSDNGPFSGLRQFLDDLNDIFKIIADVLDIGSSIKTIYEALLRLLPEDMAEALEVIVEGTLEAVGDALLAFFSPEILAGALIAAAVGLVLLGGYELYKHLKSAPDQIPQQTPQQSPPQYVPHDYGNTIPFSHNGFPQQGQGDGGNDNYSAPHDPRAYYDYGLHIWVTPWDSLTPREKNDISNGSDNNNSNPNLYHKNSFDGSGKNNLFLNSPDINGSNPQNNPLQNLNVNPTPQNAGGNNSVTITTNIQTLVKDIIINTNNLKEGADNIKQIVVQALTDAVKDFTVGSGAAV